MADDVDAPDEWEDAIVYGLADRVLDTMRRPDIKITARAEEELRRALASENEGSIMLGPDRSYLDITRYPYG